MSEDLIISHDQFFKQSFGIKEVMLDFLKSRLTQEVLSKIDIQSLRLTNKSFAGKGKLRRERYTTIHRS